MSKVRVAISVCPCCGQPRNSRDLGKKYFKEVVEDEIEVE